MLRLLKILFILLLLISFIWYVIYQINNIHIVVEFDQLTPVNGSLPVYYKGFHLGHSTKVYPSPDFTKSYINLVINSKGKMLPANITAKVRNRDKREDFIELLYPETPSDKFIRDHTIIEGKKSLDISSYISDVADSGGLDEIKDNLNTTVESANGTLNALTDLIKTGNEILIDLRPSIDATGKNIAKTTDNMAKISEELYVSTKPKRLRNSFRNIEMITENLEHSTRNLEHASLNLNSFTDHTNKETSRLLNCLLANSNVVVTNINTVVKNVNDIVKGFKVTLSQRFAGMRLVFGKPLK